MHEQPPREPEQPGEEPWDPAEQVGDVYEVEIGPGGQIEQARKLPDDDTGSGEQPPPERPRIWVGSWLDYNNGVLHGDWIDADREDAGMAESWRAREGDVDAIAAAREDDPFAILGPHLTPNGWVIRRSLGLRDNSSGFMGPVSANACPCCRSSICCWQHPDVQCC